MSSKKKLLSFLSWCTCLSLLSSYAFSIIEFRWRFLSNNFLLTLFGGIFASFCVLLLSEIKAYVDNKKSAEDALYGYSLNLYIQFTVEINNISMYLKNKNDIVPAALLDMHAPVISTANMQIKSIDYAPFRKNALYNNLMLFKQNDTSSINQHVINYNYLHQAIQLTQIESLRNGWYAYNPTASDKLVETALTKLKLAAELQKKSVEGLINAIVSQYPERYNWKKDKDFIDSIQSDIREMEMRKSAFFEP